MANEEIRAKTIEERPAEASYLKAYFALVDYSNEFHQNGDRREYDVNKLIYQLEIINQANKE